MSQPTRARTTGGARKPRNASPDTTQPSVGASSSSGRPLGDLDDAGAPRDSVGARPAAPAVQEDSLLAPDTLARTLRAVAAELERDPALARRVAAAVAGESPDSATNPTGTESVAASGEHPPTNDETHQPGRLEAIPASRLNRTFRPRLVTGASPDLGAGIPDPFALYRTLGADGLRAALDELRLGSLRAIVREHGLDPKGTLARQNDAGKLRAAILKAVARAGTRR